MEVVSATGSSTAVEAGATCGKFFLTCAPRWLACIFMAAAVSASVSAVVVGSVEASLVITVLETDVGAAAVAVTALLEVLRRAADIDAVSTESVVVMSSSSSSYQRRGAALLVGWSALEVDDVTAAVDIDETVSDEVVPVAGTVGGTS